MAWCAGGKKQSDVSTRNEPRSIPDVFAQTTTDGFVIGQFAQFSQNGYQNEEQSQSSPGLFEFSATINAIDLYTSETPMFTVAPGQAPFPKPEGIVERKRRFTRSINDALVMRLFVPDSVNISDPEFRSSIQNDLVNAVRESVSGSEKKKRSADEQELDVDLRDMGREGEALSVHFIVFEEPSGLNTNHSAIAEAMNSLGVARLSQDMHYPVVEVLHVSLDSSLVWVSLSSALSVFLIFIIVLVGWKFALYDKIKRRFIRQNQVNENELFQKTALS
ncbi:unnamed protein product, partial [Mesorhabditis belari]|uniref:Uncharacterized protein n=1 Tax=Mesorhabditis belari TaxID=2138241 RepID=A0AAF3ENR5_9BILA